MADISLVLPQEVISYFQDIFEKHSSDSAVIRFQQVMNNNEMKQVCTALIKVNPSLELLINYLEKLRLHDAVMPLAQVNIYDVPSNAKQANAFKKVAKACQDILDTFASVSREKVIEIENEPQKFKILQSGFELLEIALNRSIKVRVDNSESDFLDYYAVQSRLKVVQQTVDIVDIVELLQHAATIASQAPKMPLPIKIGGKQRPDIVHLATDLAAYVRMHYKKPLHEVVATTVNVALNLNTRAVTADWVRKVAKP